MSRERDDLGRPLPAGVTGVAGPAPRDDRTVEETLAEAQRWLDARRPFSAHEVFEDAWKSGAPADRDLWQGLAQFAVGITHAQRGNHAGALALLDRSADRLARHADAPPYGIDVAGIRSWIATFADQVRESAAGTPDYEPPRLRRAR